MDDLKWFAGLLIVMGVLWLGTRSKGVETPVENGGLIQNGETSNPSGDGFQGSVQTAPTGAVGGNTAPQKPVDPKVSLLQGKLFINSVQPAVVENEYMVIRASNENARNITITGLTVRSAVGLSGHKIGKGWGLYFPQTSGDGDPIVLPPGGVAVIASGRSPLGSIPQNGGFQINQCSGFFEQGQNFYPSLSLNCPTLKEASFPKPPNTLSDDCIDYLNQINRCVVPTAVPDYLRNDGNCQAFLFNKVSYNQCVADNKDEPGFFTGEWRIYLGRSSKLWRDRHDTVELVDTEGKVIDTYSY